MGIVLIELVTEKISTDGGFWCKYGNGEGEKLGERVGTCESIYYTKLVNLILQIIKRNSFYLINLYNIISIVI
jgi:hypothetical protein